MAGLSSIFMRPRALGVEAPQNYTPPGWYSYGILAEAGGGAGGGGYVDSFSGALSGYWGENGGLAEGATGKTYVRLRARIFVVDSPYGGGNGGAYKSSPTGYPNPGTDGGDCAIEVQVDGPYIRVHTVRGGKGGTGRSFVKPDSRDVPYRELQRDNSAYNGRGWGYRLTTNTIWWHGNYGRGGEPADDYYGVGTDGERGADYQGPPLILVG